MVGVLIGTAIQKNHQLIVDEKAELKTSHLNVIRPYSQLNRNTVFNIISVGSGGRPFSGHEVFRSHVNWQRQAVVSEPRKLDDNQLKHHLLH